MPTLSSSSSLEHILTAPTDHYELGLYHLHYGLINLLFCASHSPNKTALYYAEINMTTKNTPDVKLYSLPSSASFSALSPELGGSHDGTKLTGEQARADGTVVGAAWFRNVCKDKQRRMRLCLGNPEKVRGVVWAEMRDVKKHSHSEYCVEIPVGVEEEFDNSFEAEFHGGWEDPRKNQAALGEDDEENVDPKKKQTFRWLRTHSKEDGLENAYLSRKWSAANYKLVDENGVRIATFETNGIKSFRKMGKLKICRAATDDNGERPQYQDETSVSHGDNLRELMIVLSYCVIEEKFRRGI